MSYLQKSAKDFGKLLMCQVVHTAFYEQEKVQPGSLSGLGRFSLIKMLITGLPVITKTRIFTSTKTDTDLQS